MMVKASLQKPKNSGVCIEALSCVSMLATAAGPALIPHMDDLLRKLLAIINSYSLLTQFLALMLNTGLSQVLVDSLRELAANIPDLLPSIQVRYKCNNRFFLSAVDYQ